jgi:GT2 family glycosyltransferase
MTGVLYVAAADDLVEPAWSPDSGREGLQPKTAAVTAVVPLFNEPGPSLDRTVRGLLLQTAKPSRVIIVDDASPDPPRLEREHAELVELVRLPNNVGPAEARNRGAQLARTKYILFVDCDVILDPDWLERGVAFLERNTDTAAVSGAIVPVAGPRVLRDWRVQFIEPKVNRMVLTSPTPVTWLGGHSILVRRNLFEMIGGFDPRFRSAGEDWDFSQRLRALGHPIFCLPGMLARCHDVVSVDDLAHRSVRSTGWDLRVRAPGETCAGARQIRPMAAAASTVAVLLSRLARDVLKRRWKFLAVDVAVAIRSLTLIRQKRGRS